MYINKYTIVKYIYYFWLMLIGVKLKIEEFVDYFYPKSQSSRYNVRSRLKLFF
ncbi:unnamed protein product, partial [marine sediment metagenome]